jgi:hypothetical protein
MSKCNNRDDAAARSQLVRRCARCSFPLLPGASSERLQQLRVDSITKWRQLTAQEIQH